MLPIGSLIWVSVRPLLRLILCASFGFAITKADIFPTVAARGAGQIIINIFTPCLMFSKIVPAFSIDNIGTLGPLFLLAFIYEAIGMVTALIIKGSFWVPYRFRNSLLAAGTWGNWGDIPTSVVMSITAGPPFNSTSDQTLAVAYVSVFVFVFSLTLFPMGGYRLIAMDFSGPDVEDEEMKESVRRNRRAVFHFWQHLPRTLRRRRRGDKDSSRDVDESDEKEDSSRSSPTGVHYDVESAVGIRSRTAPGSINEFDIREDALTATAVNSRICSNAATDVVRSPTPSVTHAESDTHVDQQHGTGDMSPSTGKNVRFDEKATSSLLANETRRRRLLRHARAVLKSLAAPPSASILIAFPIALITPVKALFVTVANSPIPNAPDGQPPLAFIMDTATFVGAASVPTGLICLGSALARMQVPMNKAALQAMPVGAIGSLALGKVVLSPILGVLICQGLTSAGVIAKDDAVLRFVCIFFSCMPTATSQVYLTQVYSSTGTAEHVPAFLVPQYILLIFSMTILTAYSLNLIFE